MNKFKVIGCIVSLFFIGLLLINYFLVPFLFVLLLGSFGFTIAYWQAFIGWFLLSLLLRKLKGSVTINE
ncbi:hypothetical protein [Bacillus paramobilis]|uniref:hypothetical protein n=1 Tax=Bacillus paramobilis TaxID=2817477 RepID=UPI001BB44A2C|nr:hypothetical protein [Bacillus paramobilis]HEF5065789.1 hypothetical protein [Bacillus cereus]HEF5237773.1 hypothetical protein [Bacillus cereus]